MPDKTQSYQTPTLADFQRNIDTIIHNGEHQARASVLSIRSEMAARGLARSGATISTVIAKGDEIHAGITERCMLLIEEFAKSGALSLKTLSDATRSRLESFATMLLAGVPDAGRPPAAQQVRGQYALVFRQRLDGALRDIEIGFIKGRRIEVATVAEPPKLADALQVKPSFMGFGFDMMKGWAWFRYLWQRRSGNRGKAVDQ